MKKIDRFTGFTPIAFQFFKELGENNHKLWFDEHKPIYESEILQPLKSLALALTPGMHAIDPQFDLRPNRMLSRIYRDIRFSLDKTPYKTQMWMAFQRQVEEWVNFPAFFFEISGDDYAYGMGLYGSKKKIMDSLRQKIEYEQVHFEEITKELIPKYGFSLEGELYLRPLKNDLPEHFQPWMQRKSTYLIKRCPIGEELYNENIVQVLLRDFTATKPLYEFLADACD